jgi:hypothetical protein
VTEADIQRGVIQHLRARAASGVFFFHCPNGGWRSRVEASILSGMGVRAGVPDLILIRGSRIYGLELKTPTGRLSREQKKVLDEMRACGVDTGVARGLTEALRWLEARGILRGTTQ